MNTSKNIITLYLERFIDDQGLLNDINRMIIKLKIKSIKDFIDEYPYLFKLKDNLKREKDYREELEAREDI